MVILIRSITLKGNEINPKNKPTIAIAINAAPKPVKPQKYSVYSAKIFDVLVFFAE